MCKENLPSSHTKICLCARKICLVLILKFGLCQCTRRNFRQNRIDEDYFYKIICIENYYLQMFGMWQFLQEKLPNTLLLSFHPTIKNEYK